MDSEVANDGLATHLSTSNPKLSVGTLAILLGTLTMLGPFSLDAIFPSFRLIGMHFSVDQAAVQQILTAYLVPYAAMSVIHGPLSDSYGRKRIILCNLIIFVLASIGCALSKDLSSLLVFRAIQGLSSGAGLIVGRAVVRDVFHGDQAQQVLTQVAMIFGIAPAVAPIVGGWLLHWKWPTVFWFLAAIAAAMFVNTALVLVETKRIASRPPFSLGRLLLTYSDMIRNPRFLGLSSVAAFNFGALWLYICSAPVFVMDIFRLTEREFGWFFIPIISGMVVGSFVSGRLAGRVPKNRQIRCGFFLSGLAMICNIAYYIWFTTPHLPSAVVPLMLVSLGVALVFPIVTLAILDMYPEHRGSASSLQAFLSLILNTLIAAFLSPVIGTHTVWLAVAATCLLGIAWMAWRWQAQWLPLNMPVPVAPDRIAH